MCGPAILIAAAALSALATISSAQSQAAAQRGNAAIAAQNAEIQKQAATDSENRGANDAAVVKENAMKANATLRATAASKGLLADTGTVGDLQDQNNVYGNLNALTVRNNAQREAWGYNVNALNYTNQSNMLSWQAGQTSTNGFLSGASTFVSGVAGAYGGFGGSGSQVLAQSGPMQGRMVTPTF